MRSREAKTLFACLALITLAAAVFGAAVAGAGAAGSAAACGALCMAFTAAFCIRRAREIDGLSEYLASVYTGGEILDIRTQREGELNALRDDIYKITTILGEQKAALEADKRLLADFLGDVAHQLKTPLSAIVLQTEVWEDAAVPEAEKTACARQVAEAAERMRWLVEQLLKLCRLDAAVVRFERCETKAEELLNTAARAVAPLCAKRGVTVTCGESAAVCACDASWTAEALTNLAKNAAEHTKPGGAVSLACRQNALYTEFTVENDGAPIPDAEFPHLFERFWRGQDAAPGSAGIGLSLAKAIAQGQGGSLRAENAERGPRFTLRLYAGDEPVTGLSSACHPGQVS